MALKSDLMATGMPSAQASKLGLDPLTAVTAAGSSQTTAATLSANNVNVTTPSVGNGIILPSWTEKTTVYNSGPNTLTIYPPVGSTLTGLAQNVGLTVAAGSGAEFTPAGTSINCVISGP